MTYSTYKPTSLMNLAADSVLKICKEYATENNLTVKNSVIILLDTYPDQIKKILLDRLDFNYKIHNNKISIPLFTPNL